MKIKKWEKPWNRFERFSPLKKREKNAPQRNGTNNKQTNTKCEDDELSRAFAAAQYLCVYNK